MKHLQYVKMEYKAKLKRQFLKIKMACVIVGAKSCVKNNQRKFVLIEF